MTGTLKIKNDKYYAVLNYKDGNKYKQKWIALGLSTKGNKRRAELMLEKLKEENEDALSCSGGDQKYSDYLRSWLERKKGQVELSTWEGYKIYVEKHIAPYFDSLGLKLREVRPKHIKEYYEYKRVAGRMDGKPGGLSVAAIKKHSIVLKESLREAVVSELISSDPTASVRIPLGGSNNVERTFLSAEQANTMLKAFEGHPLQPLIYVTLYYGLRRSEVLGLRWSSIDFEKETITINHSVVKNLSIIEKDTVKTSSSYGTYKLLADVRDVLLGVKESQNINKSIFGSAYKDSDYVFTWEDGTLMRPDYVTRGFQRVLCNNGLPKMRFHDLRHSTASILYDKGWNMKDIQIWLRHSTIDITADIYTHISQSRKREMTETIDHMFAI